MLPGAGTGAGTGAGVGATVEGANKRQKSYVSW